MPDQMVPADQASRNMVVAIVILALGLGSGFLAWGWPALKQYLETCPPDRAVAVIKTALVVLFLAVVPVGGYMFLLGRRVVLEERFPPERMKVIRDTAVLTGPVARRRGRTIEALAVVMIALALAGAAYAWVEVPKIWAW